MTSSDLDAPSASGGRWWLDRDGASGALIVGVFATILALLRQTYEPGWTTDFDQLHVAARALLAGANPYEVIGPGRQFEWKWPLFYPLSTVLLTVPFASFPLPVARVLFTGIGAAIFGYGITRNSHFWRLPFCLSAAFLVCVWWGQWSLYLTAAFFLPLAAIFLLAKPNIALAFVAGARSRRQLYVVVACGLTLVAVSLLARPDWVTNWIGALMTKQYVSAPITNPGGFLLLLALLRWRRPEARVFTALVAMPQTPSFYDLVPLMVVPRNLREMSILSLLTSALYWIVVARGTSTSFNDFTHTLEQWAVWVVYLPALVMLLRRPNTSDEPPVNAERWRESPLLSPSDNRPRRRSWRSRIEALPRLDFWLLVLNAVSATAFLWGFLVTRRA